MLLSTKTLFLYEQEHSLVTQTRPEVPIWRSPSLLPLPDSVSLWLIKMPKRKMYTAMHFLMRASVIKSRGEASGALLGVLFKA